MMLRSRLPRHASRPSLSYPQRQCTHRFLTTPTTFYDSQSGLHVPIHNEHEIALFTNKLSNDFVPIQFYKESSVTESDIPGKVSSMQKLGIHGLFLPKPTFRRDNRNVETLCSIVPKNFTLFSDYSSSYNSTTHQNVNFVFDFVNARNDSHKKVDAIDNNTKKTIALRDECFYHDTVDPITVANDVATFIDSNGGGDFLLLSTSSDDNVGEQKILPTSENVLRLCEELSYIDLVGPTMKSRLMVDISICDGEEQQELIEECMFIGVNKFVVPYHINLDYGENGPISVVETIAKEQGKYILRYQD